MIKENSHTTSAEKRTDNSPGAAVVAHPLFQTLQRKPSAFKIGV